MVGRAVGVCLFALATDHSATASPRDWWHEFHEGASVSRFERWHDGLSQRVVNRRSCSNRWVSLGACRTLGNSNDYVSLADLTCDPFLSRLMAFDAVMWVFR